MPLFSLSLPSLREENAELVIRHIEAHSAGVDYEIVVVSPFEIRGPRIVHVLEEEPLGNCSAHAAAYEASSGEYIITFTDDIIPTAGWLDGLPELLQAREAEHFPFCGGMHRANWLIFGTVYGLYYPYFPVLSRRSVEAIGGYFSRDYQAHFGDPDLAMRVWDAGGRCELMPGVKIYALHQLDQTDVAFHKRTSGARDMAAFQARWAEMYGGDYGERLRDFNVDYNLEDLYGATYMANRTYVQSAALRGDISEEDLKASALTTLAFSRRRIEVNYTEAEAAGDTERLKRLTDDLRQLALQTRHILAGGDVDLPTGPLTRDGSQ